MINTSASKFLDRLINNYAFHIICVFFVILVIVKILLSSRFFGPFIFPDETLYNSIAQSIVHGKLYGKLGSFSPGYPFLLSLAYNISNNQNIIYHIMLVISAFISSTIIFPSFFIMEKYCSKAVSVLGSVTVSTLPSLNFYSFTLMTETLFIPLFLFSIWFILKSYETNNKKWELLASVSTVYLYITRSTGLAMLIAFVLTYIYYIISNLNKDRVLVLIKKKFLLMASIIIFLVCWLTYSTYFVDINQPFSDKLTKTYDFGSAHNIKGVVEHGTDIFASIKNMLIFTKFFANLISYLLVGSSFLLFIVIYYFILLLINKKPLKNHTLSMPIFYASISSLLLIIATISFLFKDKNTNLILGRYVEPIIPIIMILGIICISNFDQKIMNKRITIYFIVSSIPLILIIPYIFAWDNIIINVFNDLQNNPTLCVYNIFYGYTTFNAFARFYEPSSTFITRAISASLHPSLVMYIYFSVTVALITLSMKKKHYINLLLIFIITSSLIFSTTLYSVSVAKSNDEMNNSIAKFLTNNTNNRTTYLIDQATAPANVNIEKYVYGFWNKGNIRYVNAEKVSLKAMGLNNTTYLISTKSLPYNKIAKDGNFTLYLIKNASPLIS
jgi:hypothetical protein